MYDVRLSPTVRFEAVLYVPFFSYSSSTRCLLLKRLQRMATCGVPGSVYDRYSASEVLELLDMDEPVQEGSEDELDCDVVSADEM